MAAAVAVAVVVWPLLLLLLVLPLLAGCAGIVVDDMVMVGR